MLVKSFYLSSCVCEGRVHILIFSSIMKKVEGRKEVEHNWTDRFGGFMG
jgi:hypothetical protein